MKRNIFFILFSFLVVSGTYSQCSVEIIGPSVLCSDDYSTHQLEALGSFTSYSWSPGGETTRIIQISNPGIYSVTATDAVGCQSIDTLVVSYAPEIEPVIQLSSQYVCLGDNVHLTVTGAGPGGSYAWDNGLGTSQSHDITVSISGPTTYAVTLTDMYSCTAISSVAIVGVDVPSVVITPSHSTICKGENISLEANSLIETNGTTTYTWFPTYGLSSSAGDSIVATPQSTSTYVLTENNSIGGTTCSASASVTINVDEFNLFTPVQQTVCKGAQATVSISKNGGVAPFTYHWEIDGVHYPIHDGALSFLDTIDHPTNYSIMGIDANGCVINKSFVVDHYPDLILTGNVNLDTVCPGEPVLFNASISGGTGHPYQFMLDGEFSSTISTLYPEERKDYIFSAKDLCQQVFDTITINTYPIPYIDFDSEEYDGCVPFQTVLTPISPSPELIASYAWSFGENDVNNFSSLTSPTHIYQRKGIYGIELKIKTINGCSKDTIKDSIITVHPKPKVNFKISPLRASILKPIVFFNNTSFSSDTLSYMWSFGDGESSEAIHTQNVYSSVGQYPVELIATTNFGCSDTLVQYVQIVPELKIYIPNAFTPDNDGINETFEIKGSYISKDDYLFTVWDRNGNVIFTSESINDSWNGKFNGTGNFVTPGYYYYTLKYNDIYGAEFEKSGEINVIY